jgi:hypothetical protein
VRGRDRSKGSTIRVLTNIKARVTTNGHWIHLAQDGASDGDESLRSIKSSSFLEQLSDHQLLED